MPHTGITLQNTLDAIRQDANRYAQWHRAEGFWVTLSYRVRRLRKFGSPACQLLLPLDILLAIPRRLASDSRIPACVSVGPGFCLPHPNGVIINDKATIGRNVSLFQHVTLGEWGGKGPQVGDNCEFFAGACAFGDVRIGEGSKIGINAVVRTDVPPNSVAYLPNTVIKPRSDQPQVD